MRPAAFVKLTWLELKLFLREPIAVLFTVAYPLVVMFVIAGVFNTDRGPYFRGAGGSEYYVVSNIGVVLAAMGLIALPQHVAGYFEGGIMRRFRASSVPVSAVILAQTLVCFAVAVAATAILLAAARPAYTYHFPQSLPGVAVAFMLGLISFLAIGLLVAAIFPTTRSAQGVGLVLFFPMYLISGAGPPLGVLPVTMRDVADVNPLKYAVQALQDTWFGPGITGPDVAIPLGIAVVCGACAALLFRRR